MTLPRVIVALALLLCAADGGGALAKARKAQPQPRYPAGAYAADRKVCQLFYARAVKAEEIEDENRRLNKKDAPTPYPWKEKAGPNDPIENVRWSQLKPGEDGGIIEEIIQPHVRRAAIRRGSALDKEGYSAAQREVAKWTYYYEILNFDLDGNGQYDDIYAYIRNEDNFERAYRSAYAKHWVLNTRRYGLEPPDFGEGYSNNGQLFILNGTLYQGVGGRGGGQVTAIMTLGGGTEPLIAAFEEICRW